MIATRTLAEEPKCGEMNNRHMVIMCIFLGSLIRVVFIPVVDSVLGCPDDVKYVVRFFKDGLWFTASYIEFSARCFRRPPGGFARSRCACLGLAAHREVARRPGLCAQGLCSASVRGSAPQTQTL